jgi:hypothetical protein
MDSMVQVLKDGGDVVPTTPPFRVYRSSIGPINKAVLELDFEDMAHYARFWAEFGAAPTAAAIDARLWEHSTGEGMNEIWALA